MVAKRKRVGTRVTPVDCTGAIKSFSRRSLVPGTVHVMFQTTLLTMVRVNGATVGLMAGLGGVANGPKPIRFALTFRVVNN